MTLTEAFVLPDGAVLTPVTELPEAIRQRVGSNDGDVAVSLTNSRAYSKLVDAQAAALIGEFRQPSTIAAAVARFSRSRSLDSENLLEEALPMLRSLMTAGLLVSSASSSARRPLLALGDDVAGWTIARVLQYLEGTDIYQVRYPSGELGALKLARDEHDAAQRRIAHEADLLCELDGTVAPRLLQSGTWKSHAFLLTQWLGGADAQSVCAQHRYRADAKSRMRLLEIGASILRAYATIHERGIVHADVHARNVLIERPNARIIDFGLSRRVSQAPGSQSPPRAGVSFFFEPELARALAAGAEPPSATFAGEQYSVAALLYFLMTGGHYLDFIVERGVMLEQIGEAPMVPFAKRGVAPWSAIEALLCRALSKRAEDRFPSLDAFLKAWNAVDAPTGTPASATNESLLLRRELSAAASRSAPLRRSILPAPATSVAFGSAGVAYALYRAACASDDAVLFAAADHWSARAMREISEPTAFYDDSLHLDARMVCRASLYHGVAGVHAVNALISAARADERSWAAALHAYTTIGRDSCDHLDLTVGRAGTLLGCAHLLEVRDFPQLRTFGNELSADLWQRIDPRAPIEESPQYADLGMAHGWAGVLYATLAWCAGAAIPISSSTADRLDQLAGCAQPVSPWAWCSGSAGFVFLWTLAYRVTGDARYLHRAESAARDVWNRRVTHPSLCCGIAGQAYALLNFYRYSQEAMWLSRAQEVARTAAAAAVRLNGLASDPQWRSWSLYKGAAGVALLGIEIETPQDARMPLFECDA